MWRFCGLPSSAWVSVASGGSGAGLVQVAVAESDAAFSDRHTAGSREDRNESSPIHRKAWGASGAGTVAIPGGGARNLRARKNRLRRAEPEALPSRRKRRERAGAVGACSVNAEDPRSRTGRGCDEIRLGKAKTAGPLTVRCRCRAQVDPRGPPQGQCTQCFVSDRRVCALTVSNFSVCDRGEFRLRKKKPRALACTMHPIPTSPLI